MLRNNNVDVLTVNLAKSKFNFVDTAGVRRRFIAMKVTGNTAGEQDSNFEQNMFAGMGAVARIYPQQDGWYYGGRYDWLHDTPFWLEPIPTKSKSAPPMAITRTRVTWSRTLIRAASIGRSL